jgi:hypothetical protein
LNEQKEKRGRGATTEKGNTTKTGVEAPTRKSKNYKQGHPCRRTLYPIYRSTFGLGPGHGGAPGWGPGMGGSGAGLGPGNGGAPRFGPGMGGMGPGMGPGIGGLPDWGPGQGGGTGRFLEREEEIWGTSGDDVSACNEEEGASPDEGDSELDAKDLHTATVIGSRRRCQWNRKRREQAKLRRVHNCGNFQQQTSDANYLAFLANSNHQAYLSMSMNSNLMAFLAR